MNSKPKKPKKKKQQQMTEAQMTKYCTSAWKECRRVIHGNKSFNKVTGRR